MNGKRYTKSWFKTKKEAKQAEAKRKEEVQNPEHSMITDPIPTDMDFLELVNRRLDHIKEYNSERHYTDHIYLARRWCSYWGDKKCCEITVDMIQAFLLKRKRDISAITANKELRILRSLFNFGIQAPRHWIKENPTLGLQFFRLKRKKSMFHQKKM